MHNDEECWCFIINPDLASNQFRSNNKKKKKKIVEKEQWNVANKNCYLRSMDTEIVINYYVHHMIAWITIISISFDGVIINYLQSFYFYFVFIANFYIFLAASVPAFAFQLQGGVDSFKWCVWIIHRFPIESKKNDAKGSTFLEPLQYFLKSISSIVHNAKQTINYSFSNVESTLIEFIQFARIFGKGFFVENFSIFVIFSIIIQ